MTYTTDNRWSTGSGRALVPEDPPAAYGARWIDYETYADIVPDRQGFAYNDTVDRERLIDKLEAAQLHRNLPSFVLAAETIIPFVGWTVVLRRSGGYIYVDAWLNP
jgi:hypothetical protein